MRISKLILCIISLLTDPNTSDPYCPDIAKEYDRDRKKFNTNAMIWTEKYAKWS